MAVTHIERALVCVQALEPAFRQDPVPCFQAHTRERAVAVRAVCVRAAVVDARRALVDVGAVGAVAPVASCARAEEGSVCICTASLNTDVHTQSHTGTHS
jgi:hypothetical protein